MQRKRIPVEDRVLARLVEATDLSPNGWTGCWLWPGAHVKGYGQVTAQRPDGTYTRALTHRVIYEHVVGLIPDGLVLDHLCRRPACCNPEHLEAVTQRENTRRGIGNQNAGVTHCKRGHPLSGSNLRLEPYGSRRCRTCWYEIRRRYRARVKANGGLPLREYATEGKTSRLVGGEAAAVVSGWRDPCVRKRY